MTKDNDPKLQKLKEALLREKVEYNGLAAQRTPDLCLEDDTVLTKRMWAQEDNIKKMEKEIAELEEAERK